MSRIPNDRLPPMIPLPCIRSVLPILLPPPRHSSPCGQLHIPQHLREPLRTDFRRLSRVCPSSIVPLDRSERFPCRSSCHRESEEREFATIDGMGEEARRGGEGDVGLVVLEDTGRMEASGEGAHDALVSARLQVEVGFFGL